MSDDQRAKLSVARREYFKRNPPKAWDKFCKRGHEKAAYGDPHRCRLCTRLYREEHKERISLRARERWADGRYGLKNREGNWRRWGIVNHDGSQFKAQDYNRIFQIQGGMCKICEKHQSDQSRALSADHDHATGIIRGLLCHHCNASLGHINDDEKLLLKLIEYLRAHGDSNE